MPKAVIEYNLPEEAEEFKVAIAAYTNYSILLDIQEYVRKLSKYDERETLPKDEVIEALRELLSEYES